MLGQLPSARSEYRLGLIEDSRQMKTQDVEKKLRYPLFLVLSHVILKDLQTTWVGKILQMRKWHSIQYSCLENPKHRGAWQATVHKVTKCQT